MERKDLKNFDSEWETIQLDNSCYFTCAIYHRLDHSLNTYLVFDGHTRASKVVIENDNIKIDFLSQCEEGDFLDSAPVRAKNGNLYLLGTDIIEYNEKENKFSEHGKGRRNF